MRVVYLVIAIIFFVLTFSSYAVADRYSGSILLTSNPESLAADGKSVATISAQVRDKQGNLAPDGTTIRFSTSLGVIEDSAITQGGVARVKLIAGTIKGISVVTATWIEGQSTTQMSVTFGDQTPVVQGPAYITVEADDYLAYSADKKVVDAIGNVRIRYKSIKIEANYAQVDLERGGIVARGDDQTHPIVIHATSGDISGNRLFCPISGKGVLLSAKSGAQEVDMSSGSAVYGTESPRYLPNQFDFTDLSQSHVIVQAKRATVFLNDRIQFERARVFLDGKRILNLPLYVLSMNGYEVDGEQYLGYGDNGIKLNLPVYYSLSPSSTGAFVIRHGAPTGSNWYGSNYGWSLDMRQKFQTDTSTGIFQLSQITSGDDWGAHYTQTQRFGQNTNTYLFLDYAQHKDLFGNFNIDHNFKSFNLGLNTYGSDYSEGNTSVTTDLHAQLHPKPIGSLPLNYTFSTHLGYIASNYTESVTTGYEEITDPATGMQVVVPIVERTRNNRSGFSESVQGDMFSNPLPLSKNLSLSTSLTLGYLWGDSNQGAGLTDIASAVMNWKISPTHSLQVSYRYADRPSIYTTTIGKQSLSAMWRYSLGNKLYAMAYGVKGIDYDTTNLYGDLSYRLSKAWRVGVRGTWNQYSGISYNDLQLQLGRMVGGREVSIVWSKALSRFMLDLGSGSF